MQFCGFCDITPILLLHIGIAHCRNQKVFPVSAATFERRSYVFIIVHWNTSAMPFCEPQNSKFHGGCTRIHRSQFCVFGACGNRRCPLQTPIQKSLIHIVMDRAGVTKNGRSFDVSQEIEKRLHYANINIEFINSCVYGVVVIQHATTPRCTARIGGNTIWLLI